MEAGRVSDRVPNRVKRSILKQSVIGLFLSVAFILGAASSIFAAPSSTTLPVSCSTGASANVWSLISLTTSDTNQHPVWQWQTATSTNTTAVLQGYGYALLFDGTVVDSGELAPTQLTYTHNALADGTYQLYVWVIDGTDPTMPVADRCESAIATVDTIAPVVMGDSYTLVGDQATPDLTNNETNTTYAWTVDAPTSKVTLSNDTELNPTFTFLADGTYTFTLTATDVVGNITTVELTINYSAPVMPDPTPTPPPTPNPPVVHPSTPSQPVELPAAPPAPQHIPPARSYCASEPAADRVAVATTPAVEEVSETPTVAPPVTDVQPNTPDQITDQASIAPQARTQSSESSTGELIILGLPWYWWLLGAAIVGTAIAWYKSGVYRKGPGDL